jgi:hypothetical protein
MFIVFFKWLQVDHERVGVIKKRTPYLAAIFILFFPRFFPADDAEKSAVLNRLGQLMCRCAGS